MVKSSRAVLLLVIAIVALAVPPSVLADSPIPVRNGRIAFGADRDGDDKFDPQIYTVRPDGSGLRQLTSLDGAFQACTAWSPDGDHIAYCTDRGGDDLDVWVMKADGSDKQAVTRNDGRDDFFAAWSPNGKRLVFAVRPVGEGGDDLFIQRVDGTGRRRLTRSPAGAADLQPMWTPDGKSIVFSREVMTGENQFAATIMVVPARGGEPRQVRVDGVESAIASDVSPTGKRVLFDGDGDVHSVRIDGTRHRRLTHSPADEFLARYSPDGDRIVYLKQRRAGRQVFVAGVRGRNPQPVTSGPYLHFAPDWRFRFRR
jgi:TolB protein